MNRYTTTLFFLLLFLLSCAVQPTQTGRYDHIKDEKVVEILKKSFTTHGGLVAWEKRKELQYEKHTQLFLESGDIEKDIYQYHDYFYGKNPSINIRSKNKANQEEKIVSIDGNAVKYIDGQLDNSAKTDALNTSVITSLFVIGIPFKMMDQGVKLNYVGTDKLEDGKTVNVIQALYNPTANPHHTTPDIWWYYFDEQDAKLVGYMVKHADHYSYVRNLEYTTINGFLFPTKRGSYRVNPEREILYTRAAYAYKNWEIK